MKKLLSIVLCAVMLASALCTCIGAAQYNPETLDEDNITLNQNFMEDETFILGDANGDGMANAMDSYSLKLTIAGNSVENFLADAIDLDGDGQTTSMDSYSMKLCMAGVKPFSYFENGNQLYNLMIGGASVKDFTIVIPEDAVYDSNLYFATELLYEYVKKATGVALPIERGEASGEHAVYLYQLADDSELGAELGHEGYKYYVEGGNLYIYGTHRGCMYAAYEIIEDYLGVSFAARDNTFIYKQRVVDIAEGTEKTHVPSYRFRHTKSTYSGGSNRETGYIARGLNGSQSYNYKNEKRSLEYYGDFVGPVFNNIHSYAYYWQMGSGTVEVNENSTESEYFARYQSGEWQDETKWEPCATDEKKYQTLFTGFLYTIRMIEARGYPIKYQDGTNCYSFSANDNDQWCGCRNCGKKIRTMTGTGLYLSLANKGAQDIQEYYPGLDVFTWIYTKEIPKEVLPDDHLVVVLAGFNCGNHALGSGECVGNTIFDHNNSHFENVIDVWADMCDQTGAEIWLWYYPETHYWFMFDLPNIYNVYYDIKWLYEHGVTGFFYEGSGGGGYWFENLKAYLASQIMFDTEMTIEEYDEYVKKYLYETYGDGWEYIYEFIQMYEEAADVSGLENGGETPHCFVGNHARAYDTTSVVYINEHYEQMRDLLLAAIYAFDEEKTTNDDSRLRKLNNLFNCFEILGLGATYLDNYENGTDEQRAVYEERYTAFLNYFNANGLRIGLDISYNSNVPTEVDLSYNPVYHFMLGGSWRASVTKLLGEDGWR